jgi:hypothetical protein
LNVSRPCGVVVSIGSLWLFKPILRVINSLYNVDQVFEGAAKAIELPNDKDVSGPEILQKLAQDRPLGRGFAGRIHRELFFFGEPGKQHLDRRRVLFGRLTLGDAAWR